MSDSREIERLNSFLALTPLTRLVSVDVLSLGLKLFGQARTKLCVAGESQLASEKLAQPIGLSTTRFR